MEEAILTAARRRTTAAEVYSERGTVTLVKFIANRCDSVETRDSQGFGLRVIHNDRIGYASATNPERPEELAEAAIETSDYGPRATFSFPGIQQLLRPRIFNDRVALEPTEMTVALGDRIVEQCQQAVPDLNIELTFRKVVMQRRLLNSNGADAAYERTLFSLAFAGMTIAESRSVWLYDFVNMSEGGRCDVATLVNRVKERAGWSRRRAVLRAGTYPCVFAEFAAQDLLQSLVPAVLGRNLVTRDSPLADKEQEEVLDEKLTLLDDGLRDFAFESAPFDGEGVLRRKTAIFERGVLRSFLLDLQTAAALGRQSTGSACRAYHELPRPGPSNLVVVPGSTTLQQALAGIREGLLIYSTLGAGRSSLSGDFSFGVAPGFKVENGEITGRVKDAMVAGNILGIGRAIAGVGDTAFDLGDASIPFLFFPAIPVAVKS